jgi:tetratricopeptide (TPR) repeat protein
MAFYDEALEIAKERGYKQEESCAYLGLGDAYRLNNQIQKAMAFYDKALEIAKAQEYKLDETRAYLGLGDAYTV